MKKFIDIVMQGDLVAVLRRYADIALAVLVMLIVGMMIIPLPTPLLDVLLVLNISISLEWLGDPRDLPSFPSRRSADRSIRANARTGRRGQCLSDRHLCPG